MGGFDRNLREWGLMSTLTLQGRHRVCHTPVTEGRRREGVGAEGDAVSASRFPSQ